MLSCILREGIHFVKKGLLLRVSNDCTEKKQLDSEENRYYRL